MNRGYGSSIFLIYNLFQMFTSNHADVSVIFTLVFVHKYIDVVVLIMMMMMMMMMMMITIIIQIYLDIVVRFENGPSLDLVR